jgi:hypothetical protein
LLEATGPTKIILNNGLYKLSQPSPLFVNTQGIQIEGRGSVIIQQTTGARVVEIGESGSLRMSHVTVTGGRASGNPTSLAKPGHVHGGGIHNHGTLYLDDVTIYGNRAEVDAKDPVNAAARGGGGLYNAGIAWLRNVTIGGNESLEMGAGLSGSLGVTVGKPGTIWLENTLIMSNTGGTGNCSPGLLIVNAGGNVQSPNDICRPSIYTDQINPASPIDPITLTYSLYPRSTAVDVSDACGPTDQLGSSRPVAGIPDHSARCDSGAIEFRPSP